jgi:hypothetical protein
MVKTTHLLRIIQGSDLRSPERSLLEAHLTCSQSECKFYLLLSRFKAIEVHFLTLGSRATVSSFRAQMRKASPYLLSRYSTC